MLQNIKPNILAWVSLKNYKLLLMTQPVEPVKNYGTLYHDFTDAYIAVDQVTRDFYPQAK